jgi:hypothetical protein
MLIRQLFLKVKNKILNLISKALTKAFEAKITNEKFLKGVWNLDFELKATEELGKYFRDREGPKFSIDSLKQGEVTSVICKYFSDTSSKIIAEANKTCSHIFNLLGSGDINLSEKIDWHCDFKSGYRWNPKRNHKNIEIPYGKADIKVPWELSRFYHVINLGQAYWLTGSEKYTKEFVKQLDDWIDNNPLKLGVNWACTMEVAIRICNWIFGFYFFKDSQEVSDEFLTKFFKSLYNHGRYIMRNLELRRGGMNTNHYLTDIVCLIYLGVAFPEFKEAKKWREFGIKELIREMKKQVYPDGVDFEASTCYHRLVLELFFYATFLVIINDKNFKEDNFIEVGNEIFGKEYIRRLYQMFEFILYALKPNGKMPQIGDNDSGRLHIFADREVLDMRYLLTLGAIFFEEPRFKIKEFGFCEEGIWIFGKKGYDKWKRIQATCLDEIKSKYFKQSGIYIIRHKKDYIIISNGPNGQGGKGGHSHNDKLSFELSVEGQDIIVDPGTYVYTSDPEWRNKFRSTKYHNTIEVDGKEQNIMGDNLFRMEGNANTYLKEIKENEEVIDISLSHDGYKRLEDCVIHSRRFIYNKKTRLLRIKDEVSGEGEHNILFNLHLSDGINIRKTGTHTFTVFHRKLSSPLRIEVGNFKSVHIEERYISREYGKKEKAKVISGCIKAGLPFESELIIYIENKVSIRDIK